MFDIVVVNYHTPWDLQRFLESARELTVDHTITIMEVESSGEGVVMPRDGERWLYASENIGYARACNRGACVGDGELIGFFNADTILNDDAIIHALEVLVSSPDIAVVGPKQIDSKGRLTHAGIVGTNKRCIPRKFHSRDRGLYDVIESCVSVSGSAYLIKRDVWNEMADCPLYREADTGSVGAFLQTPHYYEETFLSYHVRAHGYEVVYDGLACIRHEWHQASPVGGWAEQQTKESRAIFERACAAHGIDC